MGGGRLAFWLPVIAAVILFHLSMPPTTCPPLPGGIGVGQSAERDRRERATQIRMTLSGLTSCLPTSVDAARTLAVPTISGAMGRWRTTGLTRRGHNTNGHARTFSLHNDTPTTRLQNDCARGALPGNAFLDAAIGCLAGMSRTARPKRVISFMPMGWPPVRLTPLPPARAATYEQHGAALGDVSWRWRIPGRPRHKGRARHSPKIKPRQTLRAAAAWRRFHYAQHGAVSWLASQHL